MKIDRVCRGESLISCFCFTLGGKDLQNLSDWRMGGPTAGLNIVIKRNITAYVTN
jgi:hypothetical protein